VLVSPSQISTFLECPRKWGFDKIDEVPRQSNAGAVRGTETHEFVGAAFTVRYPSIPRPGGPHPSNVVGDVEASKRYLKTAQPLIRRLGIQLIERAAQRGVHKSGGVPLVEHYIQVPRGDYTLHGYVDLGWDDILWDHKTSRAPEKYALDEDGLLFDPQSLTYAGWAITVLGLEQTKNVWCYVKTEGHATTIPVEQTMKRDHVLRALDELDVVGRSIMQASKAATAIDLEPNPHACGNYGGCPYAHLCPRTMDQIIAQVMGPRKDTMNLRERLQQRNGAAPRPGMDPAPVREAYERQAAAAEVPTGAPSVNAPEAPPPAARVEASRAVGAGADPKETVEQTVTNEKSLTQDEVLEAFAKGVTVFSTKRSGSHPYVTSKRLMGLHEAGKLHVELEGDTATVRAADASMLDREMFKHIVTCQDGADVEKVWKIYKGIFG
jgi:hypothetical protein